MFEIVQLLSADLGIQRSYEWFEDKREGWGVEFTDAMEAVYEVMAQYPRIAPQMEGGYHRMVVKNFNHGIFYQVHGRRIVVSPVMNLRQNPETIRARLGL